MLKNSFRALVVVTVFALPCLSFAANHASTVSSFGPGVSQLDPGAPYPDPVLKKKQPPTVDPGAPYPDPVLKKKAPPTSGN